jgi:hypothetical protein
LIQKNLRLDLLAAATSVQYIEKFDH